MLSYQISNKYVYIQYMMIISMEIKLNKYKK